MVKVGVQVPVSARSALPVKVRVSPTRDDRNIGASVRSSDWESTGLKPRRSQVRILPFAQAGSRRAPRARGGGVVPWRAPFPVGVTATRLALTQQFLVRI